MDEPLASINSSFLKLGDQSISLSQALEYLNLSGQLGSFVSEILRQHVIAQAIAARPELEISTAAIEQVIINLRLEEQLADANAFQHWLDSHGADYEGFRRSIALGLKLERLIAVVTEKNLQEAFIERKLALDKVVLSRLVVDSQDMAEELKFQLVEDGANFADLARTYSISEDHVLNGMMGSLSRGQLPDILRAEIDNAQSGDVIGPLEVNGQWSLVRVEAMLPASLTDPEIEQTLRRELFEEWLAQKIQTFQVELPAL